MNGVDKKENIRCVVGTVHPDACDRLLGVLQEKGIPVEKIQIGNG